MLSTSDKKLLRLIQADTTLSAKDLADKVGMSQATVWRRIRAFEDSELVRQRVTLLDPQALGLGVCMMVSINIRDQTADARAEFELFVETEEAIQLCMAVTGSQDYLLMVRTTDVAAFETLLMDRILAHPSVAGAHSQLVLRTPKNSNALPIP